MTRILVTGSTGQLGRDLVAHATSAGHDVVAASRSGDHPLDLEDPASCAALVLACEPEVVVHAAAWTAVDDAEAHPRRAERANGDATAAIGRAADEIGAHVVYISTDYVFDGTKVEPYVETDAPHPTSAYGRSKLAGELALASRHTIARTSWLSGGHGANMVRTILRLAREHPVLRFVDDQRGCPTFTADLAPALLELVERRAAGTFHVTNQGAVSWYGFACAVLEAAGDDPARVQPIATADLVPARPAPRPANSVLEGAARRALGLAPLRDFHEPLAELVAQVRG